MVSGQSLDLTELASERISEKELSEIHQLKTGCLIKACIEMVLHASHASEAEQQGLKTFAESLGLVFQMQDGYLDSYACPDALGKGRSSDSANEKTTFATLYNKEELQQLITHYFSLAEKALLPFYEQAGSQGQTGSLIFLLKALSERSALSNG